MFELKGSKSAGQAVALIAKRYEIERETRQLKPADRLQIRQLQCKPVADALHVWLTSQRQLLAKADATAKVIDYTLGSWTALTRFLGKGAVPIDCNAAENAIRPLAVGRKNWLFVGSQLAGERVDVLSRSACMPLQPWAASVRSNKKSVQRFVRRSPELWRRVYRMLTKVSGKLTNSGKG